MKCCLAVILIISISACKPASRIENRGQVIPTPSNILEGYRVVAFCSIPEKATEFEGKIVNVTAILVTGREYTFLYDPTCVGQGNFVWYRVTNDSVWQKLEKYINPESEEYRSTGLIRIKAKFTGTLETAKGDGFGHEGFFRYKLEIGNVGEIEEVPDDVSYPW